MLPPDSKSNVEIIQEHLRKTAEAMNAFPEGYNPGESSFEEFSGGFGVSVSALLRDERVQTRIQEINDALPPGVLWTFLEGGGLLGQGLSMYGHSITEPIDFHDLIHAGMRDPELLDLIARAMQIAKEIPSSHQDDQSTTKVSGFSPDNISAAFMAEIGRRVRVKRAPFSKTISTLLGPDALQWLSTASQEGFSKIQPHEFSRVGWKSLTFISDQIAIEEELLLFGKLNEENAKIIVALCWALVALASYMEPGIFLGEADLHLSSMRENQLTLSQGLGTHTLVTFKPGSMKAVVAVLHEALAEPVLTACDMMWIAAGLAQVQSVRAGHRDPIELHPDRYGLFLSHRGQDAKRVLADKVMGLGDQRGVFLDCLTLPRGLINRKFVFGSLAHSERILLIETPTYHTSEWCRKESWLAEAMGRLRLADVEKLPLEAAIQVIGGWSEREASRRPAEDLNYPIAPRILRDIDYWARHPNKHSLNEQGASTDFLKSIEDFLEASIASPNPDSIAAAGHEVSRLFRRVADVAPEATPVDAWATALQYAVAAFGVSSCARSKMDVRRGIDQMNSALKEIASSDIANDPTFRTDLSAYLAFISAAVMIDLAHFFVSSPVESAIRSAVGNVAIFRDGILLLDVRLPGPRRALHLKLLLTLVTHNIGSVGLVQMADDTVHEGEIDGKSLAVLPCVTLHPGMDEMFPELALSPGDAHEVPRSTRAGELYEKERWWRRLGRRLF